MSTVSQQVQALGQVELLASLTEKDLLLVATLARSVNVPAGAVMANEGEPGGDFYVILNGRVRVEVGGSPEDALGQGDYFGEMSLIDAGPRSATVTAETDVEALSVPHWSFRSLYRERPDIAETLLVEMCRRLRLSRQLRLP